ncbi:MAG: ABC transporter permease [Faecousia sp.]
MTDEKTRTKPHKLKRRNKWTRDDTELTILALPTTVWYILFCYLPMFGIVLAFKDYRIVDAGKSFLYNLLHSDWAGFKNFQYFLTLKDFPMIFRNTILYNLVFIVLDIVLPVGLAIMISNIYSKRKSKVYQTLMFMPHFMSWVVISYFVYAFLVTDKGLLNSIIRACGGENINWYSEPKYWPVILTIMHVWKVLGYSMVVYLASITGIDTSLYEAAVLDGASKAQQARYITLPSLQPIIIMMFILSVGRIFSSDFGLFYQVTRGAGQPLTPMVATFDVKIYQMVTSSAKIGQNAAASMFQSIIGCITILTANAIVRKVDKASALI